MQIAGSEHETVDLEGILFTDLRRAVRIKLASVYMP